VELLITLAIVAIIVGMILSVIAQARGAGHARVCMSNLKQLGTAFQLYLQDYGGVYPPSIRSYPDRSAWVAMPYPFIELDRPARPEEGSLYPYVRNAEVYICPTDPLGRQIRLSYGMNNKLGTHPEIAPQVHEAQIINPAETVLLVEQPFDPHYHAPAFAAGWLRCFSAAQPMPCYPEVVYAGSECEGEELGQLACRHLGRTTNVLFCDAHVRSFPPGGVKLGMFFPRLEDD
jgi:prepilin-type processing-associated H-X9-DG protein